MDDRIAATDCDRDSAAIATASPEISSDEATTAETVRAEDVEPLAIGDDNAVEPAQVVEALLFASDRPLTAGRLAELVGAGTAATIRKNIDLLNDRYAVMGLAFRIEKIAGGYQMLTEATYRPWLAKLHNHRRRTRLSKAALETLSIVAYKQPIIRAEVEAVRGVAVGDALNRLREMGLIKIVGRADLVGRPMLYGTTRKFLDVFGLADIDDLPPLETLSLRRAPEPVRADEAEDESESPAAASA
ncbi:MAG: SMC-Scp complex subunit ScpB [Phycisphaerae bacterium]|nr:SMC-Scp complex subunit ScpB [Phycisphaerae bacterium]